MEARRTAALNNVPSCMWSPAPPLELKGVSADALNANAGFVTFGNFHFSWYTLFLHETILPHRLLICAVVYPRHVEGKKLDRTVWNLLTFHAYVSYHVKVRPFNLVSFVYIELLSYYQQLPLNIWEFTSHGELDHFI